MNVWTRRVSVQREHVAANPKLKLVVLAARWPLYRDAPPFYDVNSPRIGMAASGPQHVNVLVPSFLSTIDAISAISSAQVVILGPVPELTLTPPECVAQVRHLRGNERVCWEVPADLPSARFRPAEAEIRQVLAERSAVRTFFPSWAICNTTTCTAALDRRLIYFDDDHLSASGSRRLVPDWLDLALR